MTIQDDLTAIREALDAGPTPGPWSRSLDLLGIRGDAAQPVCRAAHILDAAYIAACSPDRIARLVAHVERLEKCLEEIVADFGECRLSDRCSTALGGKE